MLLSAGRFKYEAYRNDFHFGSGRDLSGLAQHDGRLDAGTD
jgi:hypothetical protein